MVVDDEIFAVEKLARMIREFEGVQVVGTFTNPLLALDQVKISDVDVVFVDIEMPGISGIEFAGEVRATRRGISVIFVTAYSEYAVKAFDLSAVDYLLKPVSKERLQSAMAKILSRNPQKTIVKGEISAQCFGNFKVSSSGGERIRWRTKKAEELFALFINHYPKDLGRDRIIEYLWPDVDMDKAVVRFNTTLYNIKKSFVSYGIQEIILNSNGRYRVAGEIIECDLWRFEALCRELDTVHADNVDNIVDALTGEFGAPYFEGYYFNWLFDKQNYVEEQYYIMLQKATGYLRDAGELKKAIMLLLKAIDREPADESVHAELIRIYLEDGDRPGAQKIFQSYRNKLKRLTGEEPDSKMRQLLE